MNKHIYILVLALSLSVLANAQQTPAPKQSKSILILNAKAHIGNGKVIENSALAFKDGKITMIADATVIRIDKSAYDMTIDASGKEVYPGFIAPNSTLGLVEIDAIKSSDDENEIGQMNPNVRSIIAFNAESKVIETVRPNGILIAQITPRGGRISGTSSIVQLDAWTWEDAIIKENDGMHLNFPSSYKKSGSWFEPGTIEENKEYKSQVDEIITFLTNAKAYQVDNVSARNLIFEATKGIFDGSQTLFINANEEKQIIDAVQLAKSNGIKKMAKLLTDKGVLVGLENSGAMERMNTRNLPFLAGTCAAYGLDKEQALQLITSNTAKILGIDAQCGTLEIGKDATLFLSAGDALDMRTNKISHAFIQGRDISLETHQSVLNKRYKEKYNQN
jgi:imidazolonepropionase-like amidohydrolase